MGGWRYLIFSPLFLVLFACNGDKLIDEVKENPEYGWAVDSLPAFKFNISDTNYTYNLFMSVRVSSDYPFRNIWIRHHEEGPLGQKSVSRKHFVLSTPEGKWTGSGIGGLYTYEFPLATDKVYHHAGSYISQFEQYMRVDTLPHIRSVGLKVEKAAQRFSLSER